MSVPARVRALVGAALLLVNAVQHLVVEALSAAAWPRDDYSYSRDFVSELGATACGPSSGGGATCSPLHAAMNSSFLVNGVLLLLATLLLAPVLERRRAVLVALAASYAVGMAGVAAVQRTPESLADGTYAIHTAGAALALGAGNLIAVVVGVASRRIGAPGWYRALSVALGVVGLAALAGIALVSGEFPAPVLERLSVYAINGWWLITGAGVVAEQLRRAVR